MEDFCTVQVPISIKNMQDPRMMNQRKQKIQRTIRTPRKIQDDGQFREQVTEEYMRGLQEGSPSLPFPLRTARKASRRDVKNDVSLLYIPHEKSKTSMQLESSIVGKEYMALHQKFMMLKEESHHLGSDLSKVEDKIKSLEDEKLKLLDQLVVLEGLVDPSEVHNH